MSHVITKSSEVQVEFSGLVGIVFKKATKDLNVKNHQQKYQKTSAMIFWAEENQKTSAMFFDPPPKKKNVGDKLSNKNVCSQSAPWIFSRHFQWL